MATPSPVSFMILGAGGAGRLLAQGLKKRGIQCVLFEQDASIDARKRDWDYGVHWATTLVGDLLPEHISMEKVIAAQVDRLPVSPTTMLNTYNGATCEVIAVLPTPNMMRLRRREFCRVIGEGLDIRFGKRLTSIVSAGPDGPVTATFADGTTHTADFAVGAEGSRSAVRKYLVGEALAQPLQPPVVMAMVRCHLPQAQIDQFFKLGERLWVSFHPEGGYLMMGVHDSYTSEDPSTWLFTVLLCWQTAHPTRGIPFPNEGPSVVSDLKAKVMESYGEPIRSIVGGLSEDDATAWVGYTVYWPTIPWPDHEARGRVSLIGDAMHALLPQRGQGMNNAILDCVEFFKELDAGTNPDGSTSSSTSAASIDASTVAAAIKRYEASTWKRGREAVDESLENALGITDWARLKESPLWKFGIAQRARAEEERAAGGIGPGRMLEKGKEATN